MTYALRVRLYRGDTLEADTDEGLAPGAPGSERVPLLSGIQGAVVELCQAMHGPEARLLGFSDMAQHAYGCMIRERSKAATFDYSQGYSVLSGHRAELWRAQVDIAVAH